MLALALSGSLVGCEDEVLRSKITPPYCGDGNVDKDEGESCDDGNSRNNDACVDCREATCGDGYVHEGEEECDEGDDNADGSPCSSQCTGAICGDGVVQTGEECDDGANGNNEDGCDDDCKEAQVCYMEEVVEDVRQATSSLSVIRSAKSIRRRKSGSKPVMDAVVVATKSSALDDNGKWRVGTVSVLIGVKKEELSALKSGAKLTVMVWDGDDPTDGDGWELSQTLDPDELDWDAIEESKAVDDDVDIAIGGYGCKSDGDCEANETCIKHKTLGEVCAEAPTWKLAFWEFHFDQEIPEGGMSGKKFMVGLRWETDERPSVAYSDASMPCNGNWSDYGQGDGWVSNGKTSDKDECSWPVLRISSAAKDPEKVCTDADKAPAKDE